MNNIIAVSMIAGVIAAGPVFADPYLIVSASKNYDVVAAINLSSVKTEESGWKSAWMETVSNGSKVKDNAKTTKALLYIKCEDRKMAVKSTYLFDQNNTAIDSKINDDEKLRFTDIKPDSIGYKALCWDVTQLNQDSIFDISGSERFIQLANTLYEKYKTEK